MTVAQTEQRSGQSGEVAAYAPPAPAPSSKLTQFAADARAAHAVAVSLAGTPFVPTSFKKRGEKWLEHSEVAATVTAAILAGDEIGLSPMQALSGIDVIEGRPCLNAMAQRALIQQHGHRIWIAERSADRPGHRADVFVTVKGQRIGKNGDVEIEAEATWSLDRARQAGLLGKKNWQNHPEAMCFARASSEVARQIAADVLMGLAYSAEELDDTDGDELVEVAVRPRAEEAAPAPATPETPTQPAVEPSTPTEPGPSAPAEPETPEPANEPDVDLCPQRKPEDSTRACSRPAGHDGRHHYGREVAAEPEPEPEPIVDPETSEPKLQEGVADPEAPARCEAVHPELGRCSLPAGHEGQHMPESAASTEEAGDAMDATGSEEEPVDAEIVEDGVQEEELFPSPTDEELEAALEEERRMREAQAAPQQDVVLNHSHRADEQCGPTCPVYKAAALGRPAPEAAAPQEQVVAVKNVDLPDSAPDAPVDDDPWSDFQ